jgi:hypothetical protein
MQDKNIISKSLLALVPVCAILLLMASPGMYSPEPQTSQTPDESPMPDDTQVPPVVEEPVVEMPIDEPPPVEVAPGTEENDPNLTPKENCLIHRNDAYERCLTDVETLPPPSTLDELSCKMSYDQATASCECEEPVSENSAFLCRDRCTREYADCTILASYDNTRCKMEPHTVQSCINRMDQYLARCMDAYRLCMAPPPPPQPPLVAIVGPTPSYHPPS